MQLDDDLDDVRPDSPIRQVTLEVEAHVSAQGWDQPPRLYALVPTADIVRDEPQVAEQLGLDSGAEPDHLTPVEQEELPVDRQLEEILEGIEWPSGVFGCAAVVERLMLPPEAEEQMPDDPGEVATYAQNHPDRQDVRIAAAATRDGAVHCTIRVHGSDEGGDLLEGPDLVPGLVEMLCQTLAD